MEDKSTKKHFGNISEAFSSFNLVLFIIIVAVALSYSVLSVGRILNSTDEGLNSAASSTVNVSQTTLNKLSKLKSSSDNSVSDLPSGRTNPFSE